MKPESVQSFKYKEYDVTISLPKSAFEQHDLYVLLMSYYMDKDMKTWSNIREIIFKHTVVKDAMKVTVPSEELSFELVDKIINSYMELATNFFMSRLA